MKRERGDAESADSENPREQLSDVGFPFPEAQLLQFGAPPVLGLSFKLGEDTRRRAWKNGLELLQDVRRRDRPRPPDLLDR